MDKLLSDEILRQIRLIKYDRSIPLNEQVPPKENQQVTYGSALVDDKNNPCNFETEFIRTYPRCCKYKDIVTDSRIPKENTPFAVTGDNGKGFGYCHYKDKRGLQLWIPSNASVNFLDNSSRNEMKKMIVKKMFENNNKLFHRTVAQAKSFKDIKIEDVGYSTKMLSLTEPYLENILNNLLPDGTISSFSFGGNTYSMYLVFEWDTEFQFGWYTNNNVNYKEPEFIERRTGYQKFIDDYGVLISILSMLGAAVLTAFTGGAMWALYLELFIESTTGIALALRDFEKGENLMGFASLLMGGASFLKLTSAFRGVDPKLLVSAGKYIKQYNPKNETQFRSMMYYLLKNDPEVAKIIQKAMTLDDYSLNIILRELNRNIRKDTIKNLKSVLEKNPRLTQNIKFWEKLWARDISTQFGIGGLGLALNNTPLADMLNDKQKQSIKWVETIIPKQHLIFITYDMVNNEQFAKNMTEQIGIIEQVINKDIAKIGGKEEIEKRIQNTYIKECKENSVTPTLNVPDTRKTAKQLQSEGYYPTSGNYTIVTGDIDNYDELTDIDFDRNNITWVKVKPGSKLEKNIKQQEDIDKMNEPVVKPIVEPI
jgi:hypothetical protein